MSGFVLYTITIASCSLAAVFVGHICGQLEIVISLLNSFVNESVEVEEVSGKAAIERKRKMTEIVERHLRALKYVEQITIAIIIFRQSSHCL